MLYNKSNVRKLNDKKVLHKIGKQWKVVSIALLALLGGTATAVTANSRTPNISNVHTPNINISAQKPASLKPQNITTQANALHTSIVSAHMGYAHSNLQDNNNSTSSNSSSVSTSKNSGSSISFASSSSSRNSSTSESASSKTSHQFSKPDLNHIPTSARSSAVGVAQSTSVIGRSLTSVSSSSFTSNSYNGPHNISNNSITVHNLSNLSNDKHIINENQQVSKLNPVDITKADASDNSGDVANSDVWNAIPSSDWTYSGKINNSNHISGKYAPKEHALEITGGRINDATFNNRFDNILTQQIYIDGNPINLFDIQNLKFDTGVRLAKQQNSLNNMFKNLTNLRSINLSGLNAFNTSGASDMLSGMNHLSDVNLSNMNLQNASNISKMFASDTNLKHVNLSGINLQGANDIKNMFDGTHLVSVNLSGADLSSANDLSDLFAYQSNLSDVNFSNVKLPGSVSASNMFSYDASLKNLSLDGTPLSNISNTYKIFQSDNNLQSITVPNISSGEKIFNSIKSNSNFGDFVNNKGQSIQITSPSSPGASGGTYISGGTYQKVPSITYKLDFKYNGKSIDSISGTCPSGSKPSDIPGLRSDIKSDFSLALPGWKIPSNLNLKPFTTNDPTQTINVTPQLVKTTIKYYLPTSSDGVGSIVGTGSDTGDSSNMLRDSFLSEYDNKMGDDIDSSFEPGMPSGYHLIYSDNSFNFGHSDGSVYIPVAKNNITDTINFVFGKQTIKSITKSGPRGTLVNFASDIPSGYITQTSKLKLNGGSHTIPLGFSRPNGYHPVKPKQIVPSDNKNNVTDTINFVHGKQTIKSITKSGPRGTLVNFASDIPSGYITQTSKLKLNGGSHAIPLGVSRPNGYQPKPKQIVPSDNKPNKPINPNRPNNSSNSIPNRYRMPIVPSDITSQNNNTNGHPSNNNNDITPTPSNTPKPNTNKTNNKNNNTPGNINNHKSHPKKSHSINKGTPHHKHLNNRDNKANQTNPNTISGLNYQPNQANSILPNSQHGLLNINTTHHAKMATLPQTSEKSTNNVSVVGGSLLLLSLGLFGIDLNRRKHNI